MHRIHCTFTLTQEAKDILKNKADSMHLSMSSTLELLIIEDDKGQKQSFKPVSKEIDCTIPNTKTIQAPIQGDNGMSLSYDIDQFGS
jgi:hypothetical protein